MPDPSLMVNYLQWACRTLARFLVFDPPAVTSLLGAKVNREALLTVAR